MKNSEAAIRSSHQNSPRPVALLKKRLLHRCFPVNFVKFLRTPFLQNTFGQLLLKIARRHKKKTFLD